MIFFIYDYLVAKEDITHQSSANVNSGKRTVYNHEQFVATKTTSNIASGVKKTENIEDEALTSIRYVDIIDDDKDEESVENPYGDLYLNEEATFDVPISELQNDIIEKKKKEDEGFKREYAVRNQYRYQDTHLSYRTMGVSF